MNLSSLGDSVKRLNEIMMKENCQPIYELIPCVNKDGFIYKVICGSRVAMGKPASYIHRAKNNAANEMLSRIEYNFADSNYTDDDSSLKVNKTSSSPISPSVKNNVITDVQHSDLGVTNYVGALQEACIIRGLGSPLYLEEAFDNKEKTFGFKCIVTEYTGIGFGKSKKMAKHSAAQKVLDLVNASKVPIVSKSRRRKKDVSVL